jgi:hypothetical protein
MQPDADTRRWIDSLGMQPTHDGWTIQFQLSTVPMSHWFFKRNKLRPQDVSLTLTAPSWGHWSVDLRRHDGAYLVQWKQGLDIIVEAAELRYRRLTPWPALDGLAGFPALVAAIEAVLGIRFIRHANVGARWIALDARRFDDARLRAWLAPCADTWDRTMRDAPDAGGADEDENEDGRA